MSKLRCVEWCACNFSSSVQCLGSKSSRQIKDEEGFTLYLCLCCVWLSALFSSGRLEAGIKVRVALYMDLYCSTHTFKLSWRHYRTHSGHILFDYREILETKCTGNSVHGVLTSDISPPQSGASQMYYFLKQHRSKRLAFTPGGNIPRFCDVGFLLWEPAYLVS